MAHAVHCNDAELARMAETGTSISHCPTSQQFLGSGTMPWKRTVAAGVNISVGTDFGAGDEWLISMEDRFGNFDVGKEADFLVIDPSRWPPLAAAIGNGTRASDPEMARDQTLFAVLLSMREPAISGVYVKGRRLDAA